MTKPALSILTPSVPSRIADLDAWQAYEENYHGPCATLIDKLEKQIDGLPVEHIVLVDNKRRSIGGKRQSLLDIARGEYVAFVDDDDDVSDDYVKEVIDRCYSGADVITFEQDATVNGKTGRIIFDATCRIDEPWKAGATARRRPWHVCAWKRTLAQQCVFTEVNYGEDAAWVDQAAPMARSHLHIPKVLHYYQHDAETTEAPPPLT